MNKKKIIFSLLYSCTEIFGAKIIGIIVQIVLARYIVPEAFGLLAILVVLEYFAECFMNSGVSDALIQAPDLEEEDYSTAFFLYVFLALFFILVLFAIAPFVSKYYETESLTWPLRVYSLILLFSAINRSKFARLQREMKFKEQMFCRLFSTFLSGCIGIYFAVEGFGLWALVIYALSSAMFSFLFLFLIDKWTPILAFNFVRAKKFLNFGIKILGVALLNSAYNGCRSLVIGKKFTITDLAYYDRGKWIGEVVSYSLQSTIYSVLLPTLSKEQFNIEKIQIAVRKITSLCILVVLPVMVGLSLLSEQLIVLVVTEKWLMAVPFMRMLSLAFTPAPVITVWLITVISLGHSDVHLKNEFYRKIVQFIILTYSVVAYDSVMDIAIWFVIGSFIDIFIALYLMQFYTGYGIKQLACDSFRPILAVLGMSMVIQMIINNWQLVGLAGALNLIVEILVCVVVGILVYALLCYLLKAEAFLYLMNLVKNYSKRSAAL